MAQRATIAVPATPLVIDLKHEIETTIAPYNQSKREPPFTQAELMIMAWVCCKNATGTIKQAEISEWVVRTFEYYMKFAAECISSEGACSAVGLTKWTVRPLYQGLASAAASQEVPFYLVIHSNSAGPNASSDRTPTYASTLDSARTFLRRTLNNETREFSRFFDLPAEIRVMIYSEVFSHEASLEFLNPMITNSKRTPRKILRAKPYLPKRIPEDSAFTKAGWIFPGAQQDVLDPTSNLLSLLLVNRQVFEEAMPVFYNVNTFAVRDVCHLVRMLRLCGERRRAHFAHIELGSITANGKSTSYAAAKLLTQAKHLKHLTLDSVHAHFEEGPLSDYDKEAWNILSRGVGLRSIIFKKECPMLEAFVREQQAKLNDSHDENMKQRQKQSKRTRKSIKA